MPMKSGSGHIAILLIVAAGFTVGYVSRIANPPWWLPWIGGAWLLLLGYCFHFLFTYEPDPTTFKIIRALRLLKAQNVALAGEIYRIDTRLDGERDLNGLTGEMGQAEQEDHSIAVPPPAVKPQSRPMVPTERLLADLQRAQEADERIFTEQEWESIATERIGPIRADDTGDDFQDAETDESNTPNDEDRLLESRRTQGYQRPPLARTSESAISPMRHERDGAADSPTLAQQQSGDDPYRNRGNPATRSAQPYRTRSSQPTSKIPTRMRSSNESSVNDHLYPPVPAPSDEPDAGDSRNQLKGGIPIPSGISGLASPSVPDTVPDVCACGLPEADHADLWPSHAYLSRSVVREAEAYLKKSKHMKIRREVKR